MCSWGDHILGIITTGKSLLPVSELFNLHHGASYGVFGLFLGVMSIMVAGVWIEDYYPILAQRIAPFGISSFLTYAAHWPLLVLICSRSGIRPYAANPHWDPCPWAYALTLIASIAIYIVGYELFRILEWYFPHLLPPLAAQRPAKSAAPANPPKVVQERENSAV